MDLKTSIQITDKASPAIEKMKRAFNNILGSLNKLNRVEVNALSPQAIDNTNNKLGQTAAMYNKIESNIQALGEEQKQFSNSIQNSTNLADKLGTKIKMAATAFAGIFAAKNAISLIQKALDAAQIQTNAELQLQVVLNNVGAVSTAFDEIKNKAAQIQKRGIFGDEAMIAGAAEFATYMSDKDAIQNMMDTLANYAIGMSNGKEVDTNEMVNYATNLGKIMTGAYDAMSKKGFEFTEAQKAVISGTATQAQYVAVLGKNYENMSDDMRKAIAINKVIDESWVNLYENISNTPMGKIIQLKNALGDLLETVGNKLSGAVTQLFTTIQNNMPQIQKVVMWIADALNIVIIVLDNLLQMAFNVFDFFQTNWSEMRGPIITVGTAFLTWINPLNLVWIGIFGIIQLLEKVTGKSISAMGIIASSVMLLYAAIKDTIAYVWNLVAIFAEFLINVFKHPVESTQILINNLVSYIFDGLANITAMFDKTATNIANVMVSAINFIIRAWNAAVDSFGPVTAKFGLQLNKGSEINKIGSITSEFKKQAASMRMASDALKPADYWSAPRMQGVSFNDAYATGYAWGTNLEQQFKKTFANVPNNLLSNPLKNVLDDIAENTAQTASNTSTTQSDMQYLRDIAERDTINRFTTAQIKVEMTNNNAINSTLDIDGVVNILTDKLNEQLATQVEGVYA